MESTAATVGGVCLETDRGNTAAKVMGGWCARSERHTCSRRMAVLEAFL